MSAPQRTFSFDYRDDNAASTRVARTQQNLNDEPPVTAPYTDAMRDDDRSPPPDYNYPEPGHEQYEAPPPQPRFHPSAHPQSAFNTAHAQRQFSRKPAAVVSASQSNPHSAQYAPLENPFEGEPAPPPPPPHNGARVAPVAYDNTGRNRGQALGYSDSTRTASSATPGMDNFGESAAGGGIAGVAMGVAANNERESGVQALRAIDSSPTRPRGSPSRNQFMPEERGFGVNSNDSPYSPPRPRSTRGLQPQASYSSTMPLGNAAVPPGMATPEGALTPRLHPDDISLGSYPSQDHYSGDALYGESPYNRHSALWDPRVSQSNLGGIDPTTIADDGDDYAHGPGQRRTVMNPTDNYGAPAVGAAAVAAAGGGAAAGGFFARLLGRKKASFNADQYGPVPGEGMGQDGHPKSEWLAEESTSRKKMRSCVGIMAVILIAAIIIGAIVGGIIGSRNSSPSSSGSKGAPADDSKGDLNKNSAEIQKLMSNSNLHKVFPGMDYTPINTQYPDCLTTKPSQNNVTRDMAVLSLLTNRVRLYGTDCNQTEMVLHSIKALALTDMQVWMGVWLGNNDTTNTRQLAQMYEILDANGADPFAGIIIGNEVLYRKDLTEAQLSTIITDTKSNLTTKNIKLPVATSDLGDNWTASLAEIVDVVMSNVHPFFAGVTAEVAASWAWDFWQQNDVVLTQGLANAPKQVISEIGWPSAGGNDCGASECTSPTAGSIAGIGEMNTFMDTFVCQALANGTDYFWFEAFDEPWKIQFDTPGQNWEDKWGLMDVNRNLKSGLTIPNCGGKTVS